MHRRLAPPSRTSHVALVVFATLAFVLVAWSDTLHAVDDQLSSVDNPVGSLYVQVSTEASHAVRHLQESSLRLAARMGDVDGGDGDDTAASGSEASSDVLQHRIQKGLGVVRERVPPYILKLRESLHGFSVHLRKAFARNVLRRISELVRRQAEEHPLERRDAVVWDRDEQLASNLPRGSPHHEPIDELDAIDAANATKVWELRRGRVVDAIRYSWNSYVAHAAGFDELLTARRTGRNWGATSLHLTAADAMTTLHMAGLLRERDAALDEVVGAVDAIVAADVDVSHFEATIRLIGALVSMHELTGNASALHAASKIADRVVRAYDTPWGLPDTTVNFALGNHSNPEHRRRCTALSEVGSTQLELRTLSWLTGNATYNALASRAFAHVHRQLPATRLAPSMVNVSDGTWCGQAVTVGALGDSYFEYILKQHLLSNRSEDRLRSLFIDTVESIERVLVRHSPATMTAALNRTFLASAWPKDRFVHAAEDDDDGSDAADDSSGVGASVPVLATTGDVVQAGWEYDDVMPHLACFYPGLLGLGVMRLDGLDAATRSRWLNLSEAIADTCIAMYDRQATGLAPEEVRFAEALPDFVNETPYHLQRPETVESLFYLWRATRKVVYRDAAWRFFKRWERLCRAPSGGGFAGLRHVNVEASAVRRDGVMQTFWLAETLKYLLLIMSPDAALNLDEWVLNTEAHPLRASNGKLPHST